MKNFGDMLVRQSIDDQFEALNQIDPTLTARQSYFHVLTSTSYSGISPAALTQMQKLKAVKLKEVPNSSHFLHVSHKEIVQEMVLSLAP